MSNQSFTYGTAKALTPNAFKKEYTVTFNGNGGTPSNSSLKSSATLIGWEDRGSITYNGTSYNYTSFDAPYYANTYGDLYNAFGYNKYSLIQHYINNGKGEGRSVKGSSPGLYPNSATVNNLTTASNGTVPLYANWSGMPAITLPSASRTGYTFDGWYTAATGGTKVGNAGASYTPSSNITLYAHYSALPYQVTGTISNGTVTNGSQTVYYGNNSADMSFSANANYVITKVTENGTAIFNAATTAQALSSTSYKYAARTITGTKTVVATTANKYSVTFNGNGATSGTMSDQAFVYGYAQNLTSNAFTRKYKVSFNANYTGAAAVNPLDAVTAFDKWGTTSTGGTTYGNGASVNNLTTTAGGKVTLYAQWKTPGTITLPNVTRSGYTFEGWYTSETGGTKVGDAGASYTPTSDITLYAHYGIAKVRLTINETGLDADDNAIITVIKEGTAEPLYYVSLNGGNTSVIISGLPAGKYVIADKGWSHAYSVKTASVNKEILTDVTVTFEYSKKTDSPLHAEDDEVNWK